MIQKWFYRIVSVIFALLGLVSLMLTVQMWLGAVFITPLGFLFGLGEMNNYGTLVSDLINFWWHIAPGLASSCLSLIFMILTALFLWGCISAWRHIKEMPGNGYEKS